METKCLFLSLKYSSLCHILTQLKQVRIKFIKDWRSECHDQHWITRWWWTKAQTHRVSTPNLTRDHSFRMDQIAYVRSSLTTDKNKQNMTSVRLGQFVTSNLCLWTRVLSCLCRLRLTQTITTVLMIDAKGESLTTHSSFMSSCSITISYNFQQYSSDSVSHQHNETGSSKHNHENRKKKLRFLAKYLASSLLPVSECTLSRQRWREHPLTTANNISVKKGDRC